MIKIINSCWQIGKLLKLSFKMNNNFKECVVRDNKIAFDKLLNSSQNAITKYFNNLRLPGADKIICSRRLNTDFRHIISQYRENLRKNNEYFEEDTM